MIKLTIGTTTNRNIYIVDEASTIRELRDTYLPNAGGNLYLNEEYISEADLDNQLNYYELNEVGNRLVSLAKTEGAMKIKINGNYVKIISDYQLEDLKTVHKRHDSDFLEFDYAQDIDGYAETAKIVFSKDKGSISPLHIAFDANPTASGKAYVAVSMPEPIDPDAFVREYFMPLSLLKKLETNMPELMRQDNEALEPILASIEVEEE